MADWDGRGLPPGARQRLTRFGPGSARTSLLPVAGAVGVESVGLQPVGEVMGCIVEHIGWSGWGGCGYYGYGGVGGGFGGFGGGTVTSSTSRFGAFAPYVDALYRGYDTAIRRMLEEAGALGADGVVDVRLTVEHLGDTREFVALGTAVRAAARTRPRAIFATRLGGADVARLMVAGWMPFRITYGLSVAVRHDDYRTRLQQTWRAGNTEVTGYTELVTHVRADARRQLESRLAAVGADGCVGVEMGLRIWEIEPSENHRDHVAESSVFGSAVARFTGKRAGPAARSVLPLRGF
jgi:uncharacterized protein YbjQ (UPF0145 family)